MGNMSNLNKEIVKFLEEKYECKIPCNDELEDAYITDFGIDCAFSLCFDLGAKYDFDGWIDGNELIKNATMREVFEFVKEHV